MRDILQSRYLRRRVAHKQLARTSLKSARAVKVAIFVVILKITISLIVIGFKKLLFPTNSLAKVSSDSLLSDSLLSDSLLTNQSNSKL